MKVDRADGVTVAWLIIFATILANTCSACAQDSELPSIAGPCAPEVTEGRRASVEHDGVAGIWLHGAVIRCMVERLEVLPLYAERVRLLEGRLTLADERTALQRREVHLAVEAEERAAGALGSAERLRRQAEEALDAWYRHPGFWAVLGGVIVVAVEALALWAWSELTP